MDKERKKIVEAMKSEDPEEELKDQGFSIYTTESKKKGKMKDTILNIPKNIYKKCWWITDLSQ